MGREGWGETAQAVSSSQASLCRKTGSSWARSPAIGTPFGAPAVACVMQLDSISCTCAGTAGAATGGNGGAGVASTTAPSACAASTWELRPPSCPPLASPYSANSSSIYHSLTTTNSNHSNQHNDGSNNDSSSSNCSTSASQQQLQPAGCVDNSTGEAQKWRGGSVQVLSNWQVQGKSTLPPSGAAAEVQVHTHRRRCYNGRRPCALE